MNCITSRSPKFSFTASQLHLQHGLPEVWPSWAPSSPSLLDGPNGGLGPGGLSLLAANGYILVVSNNAPKLQVHRIESFRPFCARENVVFIFISFSHLLAIPTNFWSKFWEVQLFNYLHPARYPVHDLAPAQNVEVIMDCPEGFEFRTMKRWKTKLFSWVL